MITELITFVVKQLVSSPQDVVVIITKKETIDFLEIKVAPEDRGRIIGREGHTIKALRALVEAADPAKKVLIELSR